MLAGFLLAWVVSCSGEQWLALLQPCLAAAGFDSSLGCSAAGFSSHQEHQATREEHRMPPPVHTVSGGELSGVRSGTPFLGGGFWCVGGRPHRQLIWGLWKLGFCFVEVHRPTLLAGFGGC